MLYRVLITSLSPPPTNYSSDTLNIEVVPMHTTALSSPPRLHLILVWSVCSRQRLLTDVCHSYGGYSNQSKGHFARPCVLEVTCAICVAVNTTVATSVNGFTQMQC
ncbi:unnamed protein product [Taenia asiatica]|uniref:Uncharacterized protein n=1 Tax=Taenia asiatica TaxID=60517 RepID=A0A3P6NQP5_TAEAS|nr:unnamed protein product [Taenia asiatica]